MSASISNVLQSNGRVQTETLRNGLEAIGAKTAFGINVNSLAFVNSKKKVHELRGHGKEKVTTESRTFGSPVRDGHLARNTERVTELRLAGTKFAKNFRNGPCFDASLEQLVQLDRPSGESHEGLAIL